MTGDAPPEETHRRLLGRPADESGQAALAALYEGLEPTLLRGLLRRIEGGSDPGFLPVWCALAREAAPSTRKAALEAIGRLLEGAVEAVMVERLVEEGDPAIRRVAVDWLGARGSRDSLEALVTIDWRGPALAAAARGAAAAIRARLPADDLPTGALSLSASDAAEGALSEAVGAAAGEGALSEAAPAVASPAAAPPEEEARRGSLGRWERLTAPPRRVPLSVHWVATSWLGTGRVSALAVVGGFLLFPLWVCSGDALATASVSGGAPPPIAWLSAAVVAALIGAARLQGWWRAGELLRCLREGVPSTGRLVETETKVEKTGKGRPYTLRRRVFEILGEDGRHHRHAMRWSAGGAALEDEPLEPVLFIPDRQGGPTDLRLCDDLTWIRLDERGQLGVTRDALLLSLFHTCSA